MRNFSNLFDLKDRVAVVTGGSRGLGAEIVKAYARQGADVVIASRKIDNCVAVAREVESETGRRAMPYSLHAGRWNEAEPFVDAVYNAFGRVDVLVNNACMSPIYDKLADIPEQLFDSVVNLCFKGPFRLAVLFGDRMSASGGGSIINVSSIGSLRPLPSIIPYAGAKAALNAMTEGLARAYGPSVRSKHPYAWCNAYRYSEELGPSHVRRRCSGYCATQNRRAIRALWCRHLSRVGCI